MNKKDRQKREQLILDHLYIVHTIVLKIKKKFNTSVDNEDLISIGTIGLINAVDNYKTDFNTKLNTYAQRKITGAILDFFRTEDHLSRSARAKVKKIEKIIQYLEHELGREISDFEVAEELHMPIEKYQKHLRDTQQIQEDSIEESVEEDSLDIEPEQDSFYLSDNQLISQEFVDKLVQIILSFTKREQLVFCLYYYEELPMKQIGLILELKESRVSQLLQLIIKQIKEKLYEQAYEFRAYHDLCAGREW